MSKKKVIKFIAKVKDLDREYEKNNNCELDNGVYNDSSSEEDNAKENSSSKKT